MPLIVQMNYLAVLVCGVVAMGLGVLWYSPFLFGKIWLDSLDKSEDDLKKKFNPLKTYGLAFVGHLIMAYALARIMVYTGADSVAQGIRIAFLCWIGFTAATMTINAVFEGKSIRLILVDGGYHLIVLHVFGIILGAWQ